ncbi:MAG: ribosome biogenesis GTPase Der [Candidatus Omnitrophica bacterium]|nr:ribosome biogenesis GTPase Der [Candidatus Omnitrophota bacterium]
MAVSPPVIALVGRPNVGKSALFNRLLGRRKSLVDSTPGVTRDRLYGDIDWRGRELRIVDTGGLQFSRGDRIQQAIAEQVAHAMKEASLALLVCDGRQGLLPLDLEAVSWIRRWGKPVLVVVNKVDLSADQPGAHEFSGLGLGEPSVVSSLHGLGIGDLLDAILERLKIAGLEAPLEPAAKIPEVRVAIVGRPNVGKSSLINRILNEERVLVDSEPGTTRDPVEVLFVYQGQRYCLIDTAGIRSQKTLKAKADWLARMKALEVLSRAQVCVGILDASVGIVQDDLKVLDQVVSSGRPLCLAVNKWDLMPRSAAPSSIAAVISRRAPFLRFAPAVCVSAKTGFQVPNLLEKIRQVRAEAIRRLSAEECQDILESVEHHRGAPVGVRHARWFRLMQVSVGPPAFHLLGRVRRDLKPADIAFIERLIRTKAGFEGTPIYIRILGRAG